MLASAAADAIRQWRYKPAACGSTPIRLETSISVDFWLQWECLLTVISISLIEARKGEGRAQTYDIAWAWYQ
jgi:hypothetical protein